MFRRCRPLLGTFVEIEAASKAAIEAAYGTIAEVHRLMSAHEPDSDLSRINCFAHLGPVEVHPWTALVLERALFWAKESQGAFDPLWAGKAAIENGNLPRHAGQPEPVAAHWTWLELQGGSVRLLKPGCIDLGGIAKGFAVDQAVAAMRRAGMTQGLVNAGGDVFAFGEEPWTISVAHPFTRRPAVQLVLHDEAVATSAFVDGSSAHLPPLRRWTSVTVRAPNACDADALTKIAWAAPSNLRDLLARAGALALGIRPDGRVEDIGPAALAA
ncbi:MAG TPA: FAD:protein FMN transferase [Sphingomicrobium sp.]